MSIDPKFIDIIFPDDPSYKFGALEMPAFEQQSFASYGDNMPMVPESQWEELAEQLKANKTGLSSLVTRIYDQKSEGSCVANACSQAIEITQAEQFGKDKVVHLSAMSLYRRIGRSPSSGAMVSDGLKELASRGVLPLNNPENRAKYGDKVMENTGWSQRFPDNWEETAKNFRGLEWFICRSVNELISALFNRNPVVVGRAGHSICYCDPVYDGRSLLVRYANSWNERWKENGFGYDSMNLIRQSSGWAFALRSITVPA